MKKKYDVSERLYLDVVHTIVNWVILLFVGVSVILHEKLNLTRTETLVLFALCLISFNFWISVRISSLRGNLK